MARPVSSGIRPTYSHGGDSGVAGTGTGAGTAVAIYRAAGFWPPNMHFYTTGAMTVEIQCNPGGTDSQPDPNGWFTISSQVMAAPGAGTPIAIPPTFPYCRTNIAVYGGGALTSMVPCIPLPNGDMVSAQYVTMRDGGQV